MQLLSRSEEIILLAIWRLQNNAYGLSIREEVSVASDRKWSIGAVYAPLQRLEKKDLVITQQGQPEARRGGRSKVFYELTSQGKQALLDVKRVHDTQWSGIPSLTLSAVIA
jgi:PadR family transcriptional regulator PadR